MKKESFAPVADGYPAATLREYSKKLTLSFEACPRGVLVLHCEGRLIYQNEARKLAAIVTELLPAVRRMVVDLSGIKAVDSAGLGELVLTHLWAEAAGFELKFAGPSETVLYLFEMADLASVFDLYSSASQAMAAMGWEELQLA